MATKEYFKLDADKIVDDISASQKEERINIKGIDLFVYPHVYPSDKFRTTNFVLENLQALFKDKTVCDMGCGLGIVGQFALRHGAKKVVQADINPIAVENAQMNKKMHRFTDAEMTVYQSDIFENVPKQPFDLIIWNMPFHTEPHTIKDPLEHAFHDPLFKGLKKLLTQLPDYSHPGTLTFIAFSNKGNIKEIEEIFDSFNVKWELWKVINADKEYDNRIYLIR
jgi:16S rRNA G1207 methylase RsmC